MPRLRVPGFGGDKGGGSPSKKGSADAPNPVEELMNIELVSNALHALVAASVRIGVPISADI